MTYIHMMKYRANHPEYVEKENERIKQYLKDRYANDPEYREKKLEQMKKYRMMKKQQMSLNENL